jgi:hypothetical protein
MILFLIETSDLPAELVTYFELEFCDFFGDYRVKCSTGCLNQKIYGAGRQSQAARAGNKLSRVMVSGLDM